MNKETNQLIETLCSKLGTTADHLWSVLVKQAPVSAATDMILNVIWIAIIAISFFVLRKKLKEDDVPLVWMLWAIVAFLVGLAITCSITNDMAGFFNPEYWAFKQIFK